MKALRGKNDDWDTGNGNEWTTLFLQKKFQPIKRAIEQQILTMLIWILPGILSYYSWQKKIKR